MAQLLRQEDFGKGGFGAPDWLRRLLTDAQLESKVVDAATWIEETGCAESDLREDQEALDEIILFLGLRKFEIKRLKRLLLLPTSPAEKFTDAAMGADAAAGGRASPPIRGNPAGALVAGDGAGSGHKDLAQLIFEGDHFAADAASGAAADTSCRASMRSAASPGSECGTPLRHRMLATLPEATAEESDTSSLVSPQSETPTPGKDESWDLGNIREGLTCKNTFFDLSENRDEQDGRGAGPATCPLPTEGWWSGSHSDTSMQESSHHEPSPGPRVFDEFGQTPMWSPHDESSRQAVTTTRKPWADATPDCYGPTPDVQSQSTWSGSTSANKSGDRGDAKGRGGSYFANLLKGAVDAPPLDAGKQKTFNFEDADAATELCESDRDTPIDTPQPSAPSAPLAQTPTPDISSYGLQTRITTVAHLGTTPLQPFQANSYAHLQLQCLIPNSAPVVVPPGHRGGPLRLELARQLGVQHGALQSIHAGRVMTRANTWNGDEKKKTRKMYPDPGRGRRGKKDGQEKATRSQTKAKAAGAASPVSAELAVVSGGGSPAAVTPKKPCRHRGSKEAKDPDPIPNDPHNGLPFGTWIDLGALERS